MDKQKKKLDIKAWQRAKLNSPSVVEDLDENGVGIRVAVDAAEGVEADVFCGQVAVDVVNSDVNNGGQAENVERRGTLLSDENEVAGDGADVDGGVRLLADLSSEMGQVDAKEKRGFGENEDGDERKGVSDENKEKLEGNVREMSEVKDGDEDAVSSDGEYEFCVGDFVWGKVKSHPWWPGQIYDPSDASEYALKIKQRNRFLVAYFDGTFAWCHQSQLKPFVDNFDELSKQASSNNFVNAMDQALEEIGRLVQLKLTCGCLSKESMVGLARPYAVNSGIKEGVLVPDSGIAKLWSSLFDPKDCLTKLKDVSRGGSVGNLLEATELKCWIWSFVRSKGGYPLPLYHEPQPIHGLEDKDQNLAVEIFGDSNTLGIRNPGPVEEEGLASPERTNVGQADQFSLQRCNGSSVNGSQRQKRKSIADIIKKDDENAKEKKEKKKKKSVDEANSGSTSRPKRRRLQKLLETAAVAEPPSVDDSGSEEETVKVPRSSGKKRKSSSQNKIRSGSDEGKNEMVKGQMSRERKLSKYLCYPYTNFIIGPSKRDSSAEEFRISYRTREAEQDSEDVVAASAPVVRLPTEDVISGIRALATDVYAVTEDDYFDGVVDYVSEFRNSVFRDGADYESYSRSQAGKKKKKTRGDREIGSSSSAEPMMKETSKTPDMRKASRKANSNKAELKQASETSEKAMTSAKDKESSAAVLAIFGPGATMPTKGDLIRTYGKFGSLNKEETDMYYNNHCARIVFLRRSEAEVAFDSSQLACPFGDSSLVKFEIEYPMSSRKPSKRRRSVGESSSKPVKESNTGEETASAAGDVKASQVCAVKEKLDQISTDLANAGDREISSEMKAKLESQINGLIEEVNGMA